jgi:hypothetical protein
MFPGIRRRAKNKKWGKRRKGKKGRRSSTFYNDQAGSVRGKPPSLKRAEKEVFLYNSGIIKPVRKR